MRRGFTLIELLVVISILLLLVGLAMPLVGIARRSAAQKNTAALMAKVETALGLFRTDVGVFPYQRHPTSDPFPAADNMLGWVLAHAMTVDERQDLDADLEVVRQAYRPGGAHALTDADVLSGHHDSVKSVHVALVNRMASERASLAMLSGNTGILGVRNRPTTAVVGSPRSRGYADDYLSADLAREEIQGDVLVDRYRKPLVYICPVVPAMKRCFPADNSVPVDTVHYGLGAEGRAVSGASDADMRSTAPARLRLGWELFSSGADGVMDPQRDHPANRDNISLGVRRGELP